VAPPANVAPPPSAEKNMTPRAAAPPARPSRLHFTAGLPAGETALIRDDDGKALYSYRSFASVIGIVASLVAAIVLITGVSASAFLLVEKHPLTAILSFVLSIFFSLMIVMLVPPVTVTLFTDDTPSLTISQRSRTSFPSATYAVVTPDGHTLAQLRKTFLSRLGRNQWSILDAAGREIGQAREESFSRAIVRKIAGKFSRHFEANVGIFAAGREVAEIDRRGGNVLEIRSEDFIERRVLVALATLIIGAEP
jgi:hypothetical protein